MWKAYFKWAALRDYARFLAKVFVDERFAFYGPAARHPAEPPALAARRRSRRRRRSARRSASSTSRSTSRRRARRAWTQLVANLLAAYKQSIDGLDWMGPETKKEAQAKLAKFTPKIGYPDKWRDYSTLVDRHPTTSSAT